MEIIKGTRGVNKHSKRPGILDEDLDPEIEAAKRKKFKKKGKIEITEEDEDDL